MKKAHEFCQADPKTKVSDDYMSKAAKGEAGNEPNVGAHILCMSTQMGYQDANGKPVKERMKKTLGHFITDEAKLEETVNKCAVDKDTNEETARHLWGCMREAIPQHN